MIIAIPSVTEYIQTSRKNSYIVTAQSFIDAATTKVNSMEYDVMDVDATYYLPTKCISFEKGGESPFGEFEESYVVVTYDGKGYDYYYTGRDSSNHGIVLTFRELLDESYIETDTKTIDLTVGVGHREKIIRYTTDCNKSSYEEITATKLIEEHGTLKDGSTKLDEVTSPSCFEFDSSTGTITDYKCGGTYNNLSFEMINEDKCFEYLTNLGFTGAETELRSYCRSDGSFEYSLTDDIINGHFSSNEITEMLNIGIIKTIKTNVSTANQNVIIPKNINGVEVIRIGADAFSGKGLYTIEIPETIQSIGNYAFDNNEFLYNIVNKSTAPINWVATLVYTGSSANGVVDGENIKTNSCYEYFSLIKLTNKRVSHNIEGMFEVNYDTMILKDDKGFDIYANGSKIEEGQILDCDYANSSFENVAFSGKIKPEVTRLTKQKYSVQPMSCMAPNLIISVKNGSEEIFRTGFFMCVR